MPQPRLDNEFGPCPECHIIRTMWDQLDYGKDSVRVMAHFYQRSYVGSPDYIPPRCSVCFDKAIKEEEVNTTNG